VAPFTGSLSAPNNVNVFLDVTTLAQFDPALSIDVSTVGIGAADFAAGTISNGYSTQFVVVPKPGGIALVGLGFGLAVLCRTRSSGIGPPGRPRG
jgi:hypothetical protein